jgi:hypothetical protein
LWTDDPAAVSGNANQVLQYNGATIFAQFSASDGGWTVDGGQPYLIAQQDPYDNQSSGDPYLDWTVTPTVSSIASAYNLSRATAIEITARDGNGAWGGRVLSAYVDGVDFGGNAQHIATSGFALANALGAYTNWFGMTPPVLTPGVPTAVTATGSDAGVVVRWSPPTSTGGSAITGYVVTFGSLTIRTAASTRVAFAGPRVNGSAAVVQVRAQNSSGLGPAAYVGATPQAQPQLVHPLAPTRLFDTRSPATTVDSTHPYQFSVAGKAGIPGIGARGVQLALTVANATANGVIRVHTLGEVPLDTAAVAYQAGKITTATLDVPTFASYTLVFEVSGGSVALIADVMGYSGAGGDEVTAITPKVAATINSVPLGGTAVDVRSLVGSGPTGVLVDVDATTSATTSGYLRLWPDGSAPTVAQVAVRPGGPNHSVVLLPIGSDGAIRVGSNNPVFGATVTILGVTGPASAAGGSLETVPAVGTADPVRGTAALNVSTTPASLTVLGTPQIASSQVQLLVLYVTVSNASAAGTLRVSPAGGATATTVAFSPGAATTATVAVRPGTNGAVSFATSSGTATVAVDAVGYVTGP